MPKQLKLVAFCDGSGNSPRGSSCGCVILDENGQIILERSKFLPGRRTNNIAEYSGVLLSLECALDLEADCLEIFSDSQLIVNQINEKWDCKDVDLAVIREEVWVLAGRLESVSISWVPREQNVKADLLCRECLDYHSPKKSK